MNNKFNKLNILYQNIFLDQIILDKEYIYEDIENNFKTEFIKNYKFMVSIGDSYTLSLNIFKSYLFDIELFGTKIKDKLNCESKRLLLYIEVLDFLANSDFIDKTIKLNNKPLSFSFTSIIAQRNHEIAITFFKELQESNQLVCNFLTRDIIENIKLYLYFIRGAIKEETSKNNSGTLKKEIISDEIIKSIENVLSIENSDWNYNIKTILKNNPSLMLWKEDLKNINKINDNCNSVIHKLGISKILPDLIRYSKQKITREDIYFCIKFFVTLVICYDGKAISSSDYIDYLDMGLEPPEDSQYWISPIVKNFITSEYTQLEIKNLKNMSYMDI